MKDVSKYMEYNVLDIDGELLPITKCLCGAEFGYWEFILGVYEDTAKSCPKCGIKFYFEHAGVRIYTVKDE